MKDYNIASRICDLQKKGVADGIISIVKDVIRNNKMKISDYIVSHNLDNGEIYKQPCVTAVLPTPNSLKEAFLNYPTFWQHIQCGWIDMIHFDDELHFHIMCYNAKAGEFTNGHWHTVRECLSLEETCKLFEYVDDVRDNIVVLPVDEHDKYNNTGAFGVVTL